MYFEPGVIIIVYYLIYVLCISISARPYFSNGLKIQYWIYNQESRNS